MKKRPDIWTILIVTAVSFLIWYWAAGETRETGEYTLRVQFNTSDPAGWLVIPAEKKTVDLVVEGSRRAINRLREIKDILIEVPAQIGMHATDVAERLRVHPIISDTGVSIVSARPYVMDVEVDRFDHVTARVLPEIQNVDVEDIVVEPTQVSIRVPSRQRPLGDDITVAPAINRQDLERLAPGTRHTLEGVKLRRQDGLLSNPAVTVDPPTVRLSFTIRSQLGEIIVDRVRVWEAGSAEDQEQVEFEPNVLDNVTVTAPASLIDEIREGGVTVVALVYLKSREKYERIDRKPVSCYVALRPDGSMEQVRATINDSADPPIIGIHITDRAAE